MKKLGCLYTGLLVLSFSAKAMEADVIKLGTTSPVNYTLPKAKSLEEVCIQYFIDVLLSNGEHSDKLLELLEGEGMKGHSDLVKAALINDYLVVLCEQLPVAELDYYKEREPKEGRSEIDCAFEGVMAGALTSDEGKEGIVFLSVRKEGEGFGAYLEYWPLGDLVNREKEPRYQCKIPIRLVGDLQSLSLYLKMFSEPYTNRFFIYCCSYSECQLWRLGAEGFEHELSFKFRPDSIKFSPDGKKLCMIGNCNPSNLLLFKDIDTLKSHAEGNILKEDQLKSFGVSGDIYKSTNPLVELCALSSDWSSEGIIAMLRGWPSQRIELRDIGDISQIKACFSVNQEELGRSFSGLRILANGRYILVTEREKAWLIDTASKRAELIASSDFSKRTCRGSVKCGDGLRTSNDERFAILTWQGRNPILYDLRRKMNVEIKVASEEEISESFSVLKNSPVRNGLVCFHTNNSRSAYLTSRNDILLFILDRRIRFVCLKLALEAKSLRELVEQIRKRNAITTENTHHQVDGE